MWTCSQFPRNDILIDVTVLYMVPKCACWESPDNHTIVEIYVTFKGREDQETKYPTSVTQYYSWEYNIYGNILGSDASQAQGPGMCTPSWLVMLSLNISLVHENNPDLH